MERTRRGRPIGPGRVNRAIVETVTEDDVRRFLIADGFDPDRPADGYRPIRPLASVRARTGLTQERFAEALRIPVATLRNWEQGRTTPDPVALSFFALVDDDPERAFKVLSKQPVE